MSNSTLSLEELQEVLSLAGVDNDKRKEVARLANQLINAKQEEAEAEAASNPKNKYRFVLFVRGEESLKPQLEGGAWIVAVADSIADERNKTPATFDVQTHLITCAARQNNKASTQRRGPKLKGGMIQRWRDVFSYLKPTTIKECGTGLQIKTKLPVEVRVLTDELIDFSGTMPKQERTAIEELTGR